MGCPQILGGRLLSPGGVLTPLSSPQLHLKFCYEAVLQHAEQVLQRHGVGTPGPKPPNSTSPKVGAGSWGRGGGIKASAHPPRGAHGALSSQLYFHQDPQDLVLGGDLSISSIQATIAKLSIKPPGAGGEIGGGWGLDPAPGPDPAPPEALPALPDGVLDGVMDGSAAPIPEPTPPAPPEPPAEAESSNHVEEEPPKPPPVEPSGPSQPPQPPASAPSSSSLELLASLTPEAFTLDASLKGKQRMNKQNFLQAQTGEGLRGPRPTDDPLSMLDPLWTLNKS